MSSFVTLALVLPALGNPVAADLAVGFDARDSAGLVPSRDGVRNAEGGQDGNRSEFANRFVLQLLSGLRLANDRTSFVLRYIPRLTLQTPNPLDGVEGADRYRPLLYQTLSADYSTLLSRRLSMELQAVGAYGEVSYIDQARFLDAGSSTVDATALQVGRAQARSEFSYLTGRANTVSLLLRGSYQNGIRYDETPDAAVLPESLDVSGTLSDAYRVSAVDSLSASITGSRIWGEFRPRIFGLDAGVVDDDELSIPEYLIATSVSGTLGWIRTTSPTSSLELAAGLGMFVRDVGDDLTELAAAQGQDLGSVSFFPTARIARNSQIRALDLMWINTLAFDIQGAVDNARGTFRPIASLSWSVSTTIVGKWTVASELFASTSATGEPLFVAAQGLPAYESTVRWTIPVSYPVSERVFLNFGATGGLRAGHWTQLDEPSVQPTLTGFIGLRYTTGTGLARGTWL